jgi:putative tricarboxylic transport membrane protein
VKIGSVVFAGLMLVVGLVYETMALNMPRGTLAYPGPGLFPMIIGAFMVAMALGCLVREFLPRKRDKVPAIMPAPIEAPAAPEDRDVMKTLQLTALMIAYIFALKPLGFPIAICIFLAIAIRIFGYRKWLPALAMAVVITVISYVSFVLWLSVPLPLGILEEVLG